MLIKVEQSLQDARIISSSSRLTVRFDRNCQDLNDLPK